MIDYNLQFFGGRGASAGIGSGGSHSYESGDMTEAEHDNYIENQIQKLDDWIDDKKSTEIEVDGDIFEKFTSLKEVKTWFKGYTDGYVSDDEAWVILYKDGSHKYIGGGDSTKKVSLTNVDTIIYENETSTMIYGHNVQFYNDTDYEEYKRRGPGIWRADFI